MAVTTGTSLSSLSVPVIPDQIGPVTPILQMQDGSFVGEVQVSAGQGQENMIASAAPVVHRWKKFDALPPVDQSNETITSVSGLLAVSAASRAWDPNQKRHPVS